MLLGFTPPYTKSGRSALVQAPPWHYAGRIVSLAAELESTLADQFLPSGFGSSTGRAFGHFCEWQATTDGSELCDPIYSQYEEFFYLLEAKRDGELRLFCPFIYVNQDISMIRGMLQGWPKKMGSIWITRSYDLDHPAAARNCTGTEMGATLAAKDRRLAEAKWKLTGRKGSPIGFLATPTYGLVGSPSVIQKPNAGSQTLVKQAVSTTAIGPVFEATGALKLFDSPRDELGKLAPSATTEVTLCDFALTVTGVTEAE
ncbi:MAG: acetoacetate decarboxylase family protein [Sneathiella sp.]